MAKKRMTDEELANFNIWSYLGEDAYKNHLADLKEKMALPVEPFDTEEPPLPGMHKEGTDWIPDDVEAFSGNHTKFEILALRNKRFRLRAEQQKAETPEISEAVQPGHQCTDTTVAPTVDTKAPSKTTPKTKASVKPEVTPESLTEPPIPAASSAETTWNKSEPSVGKDTTGDVEQSRNTRVSSKMVNADFNELAREFFHTTSLGEKKPVFLPLELRNALETLARLSGIPNLAPSHIVINILRAFFNEHRDLINRKLSGVKLSV